MKNLKSLVLPLAVAMVVVSIVWFLRFKQSPDQAGHPQSREAVAATSDPQPAPAAEISPSEDGVKAGENPQAADPTGVNPAAVAQEVIPQPDMAKITAFDDWSARWAAADEAGRAAMREEGGRLAQERRAEFKALIVTDPRQALEEAVPRVIRQDLPEEIVAQLEKTVATTGEYTKFLGLAAPGAPVPERKLEFNTFETKSGEKFKAHVFGKMAEVMWKKQMPLQGVAVDNEVAVAENPVRKLEAGERIPEGTIVEQTCPVSGITTEAPATGEAVSEDTPTVEIGERVITLCNGFRELLRSPWSRPRSRCP
ncbi:MAG: hypothetical protein ABIT37_25475 [Luteolibacter sp.]